jgi:hypothetical protein
MNTLLSRFNVRMRRRQRCLLCVQRLARPLDGAMNTGGLEIADAVVIHVNLAMQKEGMRR